ncbi:unnamed protein product [Eruca vesicaria subsp. sativa]|uniref:Uncharacterized protein n=1 Tax=Eruca vesicaria subsp. sativa TaxID=29727 RepID=A0ABC8KWX7_ERUVS|nr:unnamed protein product [Eruca vesicaria subsp. sativa]
MKLKFTDAAAIVNVFAGVSAVAHLGMQFLVDAFIGHFWVLCFSTLAFSFVSSYTSSQLWFPQISQWFVRFAVPAGCEVLAMLIFLSGASSYERKGLVGAF